MKILDLKIFLKFCKRRIVSHFGELIYGAFDVYFWVKETHGGFVGRADFSDQFKKIIVRYKRIGYNINKMRQSACLVFNQITVNNFASRFNCTPVGRASDSMMAPT